MAVYSHESILISRQDAKNAKNLFSSHSSVGATLVAPVISARSIARPSATAKDLVPFSEDSEGQAQRFEGGCPEQGHVAFFSEYHVGHSGSFRRIERTLRLSCEPPGSPSASRNSSLMIGLIFNFFRTWRTRDHGINRTGINDQLHLSSVFFGLAGLPTSIFNTVIPISLHSSVRAT